MTSNEQRAVLQRKIWQIANDTCEQIDISRRVAELKASLEKIDQLRRYTDCIVNELEGA